MKQKHVPGFAHVLRILSGILLATTTLVTSGVHAAAPVPTAVPTTTPGGGTANPYDPRNGHAYRHGATTTLETAAKMKAYAAAHPAKNQGGGSGGGPGNNLSYNGGVDGVGVTTGHPQVYLVFYGSQWGSSGTNGDGNTTFAGDPDGMAPRLQQLFKGLGTNQEQWSGVTTQYCEGVAPGAQTCPDGAAHVGYPASGMLAGIWEDTSAPSPLSATFEQLAAEAVSAAAHFGNSTGASNRNVQYVVLSPHNTYPDGFNDGGGFCAWHYYKTSAAGDIAYTNMPYVTDAGASCGQNFVNSGPAGALDGVTIVEGHEYVETITDQFPSGGWTDVFGEESADKCEWISSGSGASADVSFATGSFAMQGTWANDANQGRGDCLISHQIFGDGIISGTVKDGASVPIAGASLQATGGFTAVTDSGGHYQLHVLAGTYVVTVSKYGYVTATASGVSVTPPAPTTQDFTLVSESASSLSGIVKDAASGWPLYARIDIPGYPSGPVFTNPLTGAYTLPLANASYDFTITAMSGGYQPSVVPVVVSANATRNFDLSVDALACRAPGYQLTPGTPLSTEGFDSATAPALPANWSVLNISGHRGNWSSATVSLFPPAIAPHSAPNMVIFDSASANPGNSALLYQTSGIDLSGQANGEVSLWMYHDTGFSGSVDTVQVQISTDAGATWNNVGSPFVRYDGTTGWAQHRVNLNAYTGAGMTDVRVGLLGISGFGNDIHIDDLVVSTASQCNPIASTGLVIGSVFDTNTNTLVRNAAVQDAALHPASLIDSSADPAAPDQLYLIAEPAGVQTLKASAPPYGSDTETPIVVAGGIIRQDFHLPVGRLSTSPTSLSFSVNTTAPRASKPLALNNTGGNSASYEVFAIPGVFASPAAQGPFARRASHADPKSLHAKDASQIHTAFASSHAPVLTAGNVTSAWATGLTYAWGIGFNTDATDLWLGNIAVAGGDDFNYRFLPDGTNTGEKISTTPWVSVFGGDMTYNPFTHTLWQVNVGNDSCIYEMSPATLAATGKRICPDFAGFSERGLAFDPRTNSYYSGSWEDGVINHFAPNGAMLDSAFVGLPIAGMAFNPSTGHLFVSVNTNHPSGVFDIYVLDARNAYKIVGVFNLEQNGVEAFADFGQSGLEIDCNGKLWAVDQSSQKVYVADSGETGTCNWKAAWLSVTPGKGSIGAGGHAGLTVKVNAAGLSRGIHHAYLRIVGDTPYGDYLVPVAVTVGHQVVVTSDSLAAQDGWVLESAQGSNTGGPLNSTATKLLLGDNASNRQYRAILSFNTSALPDNAAISSVVLRIRQNGAPVGTNPFTVLGNLWADIRHGSFGTAALQASDFNAAASATRVGAFNPTPVNGWYTDTLSSAGDASINKTGLTQLRLYFELSNNSNSLADYMPFLSGNAGSSRPQLVITYFVP